MLRHVRSGLEAEVPDEPTPDTDRAPALTY
jgi:hypothetical protein